MHLLKPLKLTSMEFSQVFVFKMMFFPLKKGQDVTMPYLKNVSF